MLNKKQNIITETKQYEFYHIKSKLKVLKSKENLLFKIIQLFFKDPKPDPDV